MEVGQQRIPRPTAIPKGNHTTRHEFRLQCQCLHQLHEASIAEHQRACQDDEGLAFELTAPTWPAITITKATNTPVLTLSWIYRPPTIPSYRCTFDRVKVGPVHDGVQLSGTLDSQQQCSKPAYLRCAYECVDHPSSMWSVSMAYRSHSRPE